MLSFKKKRPSKKAIMAPMVVASEQTRVPSHGPNSSPANMAKVTPGSAKTTPVSYTHLVPSAGQASILFRRHSRQDRSTVSAPTYPVRLQGRDGYALTIPDLPGPGRVGKEEAARIRPCLLYTSYRA